MHKEFARYNDQEPFTITSNDWFNNFVAPTNCKDAGLQEDQVKQDLRIASNINLM